MAQTDSDPLTPDRSPASSRLSAPTVAELAQKVFANKARRRSWLASLPVEEKYRRFLHLQRMVSQIKKAAGKPAQTPWPDDAHEASSTE